MLHKRFGPFPLLPAVFVISLLIIALLAGGFTYASVQERNDSFCASCHTQPEVRYYQRSTGAAPVDLASLHTTKDVQCIECHDGSGVFGHVQAVLLGARNTALFYSGRAVQPARQTIPISDDACLKCHEATVLLLARNNHEHTLLARWQAIDRHAGGCTSCHTAHTTDGPALHGFYDAARGQVTCDGCHRILRDTNR